MHTPEPLNGTILVIDKADHIIEELAIFKSAGLTVVSANTASEGFLKARAEHPDIVISEVMLEKPDAGFILGYKMKNDSALANIPLVLISSIFQHTGLVFDLNTPEARRWIKADMYLERPIAPERLLAKVTTLLRDSIKEKKQEVH